MLSLATFETVVVGGEAAKTKLRTGLNRRLCAAEEKEIKAFAVSGAKLLRSGHEAAVFAVANGNANVRRKERRKRIKVGHTFHGYSTPPLQYLPMTGPTKKVQSVQSSIITVLL